MSSFSGKCDLWDSLIMIHEMDKKNEWNKLDLFQITKDSYFDEAGWHNAKRIPVKSLKDLVPYGPYLISIAGFSKDKYSVYIGEESYLDTREKATLNLILEDFKKIYRSSKRKKEEFIPEKVVDEYFSFFDNKSVLSEIANRVKKHPTSANIDGLRAGRLYEYYRNEWLIEMMKLGYTEEQAKAWIYENRKTW